MKNKKAFTLIELLVVIAIIGIIATLAIVALQQARQNARDAKRVADVKQMSTALEMYFNEHQSYPESIDDLKEAGYMQMIPEAPTPADKGCEESGDYLYSVSENKGFYYLRFCTAKQVADLTPGNLYMTPGGIIKDYSDEVSIPDPDPFCDPNEPVVFVDENGNGYYDVHTCCELNAIRNNPSANYELVNNLDCSNTENWSQNISGTTYEGFVTILNFSGSLNGNNNTISGLALASFFAPYSGLVVIPAGADVSISNLKIGNSRVESNIYAAFISPLVEGDLSIDNVSLSNSVINNSKNTSSGFVATLSGGSLSVNNSRINGLEINGGGYNLSSMLGQAINNSSFSINNSHASNLHFIANGSGGFGGLVGSNNSQSFNNVISNSSVVNSEMICLSGCLYMGGIAKEVYNLTLENSYVSGVDFDNGNGNGAGGLISEAYNTNISNSYVANSRLGITEGATSRYCGLLYSGSNVSIDESYTSNLVIRPESSVHGAGMVCFLSNSSSISNSYVSNLDLSSNASVILSGLANHLSDGSIISNSYVIDSVISNNCQNTSGLVDWMSDGEISNSHVINTDVISRGCSTVGLVSTLHSTNVSNSSFRGGSVSVVSGPGNTAGFALRAYGETNISNSFFEGDISVSYSNSVDSTTAGFVKSISDSATITNSYYSGEITSNASDISCFVNEASGSVSQSYYNGDKCTFGDSKATGLSDAQMRDSSSYSNWNINTPSCDGANDSNPWRWTSGNYPCLYSDLTCSCS